MKITDLEIDGFGVWNNLKLTGLLPPRDCLLRPERSRQDDRHAVHAERPLRHVARAPQEVPAAARRRSARRHARHRRRATSAFGRPASPIAGPDDVGRVICTTPDGATGGDRLLRESLGDVDEPTFTNVFAVGLDEIHELGSLSGSKAAEWIYRLTSGLDRVRPVRRHSGTPRQSPRAPQRRRPIVAHRQPHHPARPPAGRR
jgi:hypothetical protein